MILVTGGAGFIGANFIRHWFENSDEGIITLDALTYAGDLRRLSDIRERHFHFIKGDIADAALLERIFAEHKPRAVIHFAAETHVDRSISGPGSFVQTNVIGTFRLLEAVEEYWRQLSGAEKRDFRFLHISTDEVFGALGPSDQPFSEVTPYAPNSPYSASKASSDHFVRAFHKTYGLPTLITNCSNNYGPYQYPEKLIPLMILNALSGRPLPVYGDGLQIRDWLHVADHCEAIRIVLQDGDPGTTYCIGGDSETANITIVTEICSILNDIAPLERNREAKAVMLSQGLIGSQYEELITFIADRPGHDRRYAVDFSKIANDLNWGPKTDFRLGLRTTVEWYLEHHDWMSVEAEGEFKVWRSKQYGNAR
jgi:dTDP-glucose 4,6-dehydratase